MIKRKIFFERAIFLSWYCSKGDCKFCYMSTQKNRIKNPKLARRTKESILVEVLLCKLFSWKIEFLSGGYESYEFNELVQLIKEIFIVYGKKVWLNMGVLKEDELRRLLPYIEGVSGAVECITPKLHDKLCPSKPVSDIVKMFKICDKLKIKKSMTLILGLGEKIEDFSFLKDFIKKYKIDQITFYRLKPQKGTELETAKPITSKYYLKWVSITKKEFPEVKVIVGSWLTHLSEIPLLLKAGAEGITKFPSVNEFNSKYAKKIKKDIENAGMIFASNITRKIKVDIEKEVNNLPFDKILQKKIKLKLKDYLDTMI